ncbi:hypothetical protein SAMN04487895_105322 [Paenibacillus sophorae]|uniref:Uncharacterized protein n=1 Tax=Paenibacillus sophorae TaxID=1333845 RepID=A0A1H8MNF4_9BACL|nr:hypothetical protein [Paenibacillus sophorae]QWU17883.1 hypothetical protein KP014_12560 [Paenibacillus sophorae]SEO18849.1 hypothetical protein SAMN04487895_105322 [Paenibacillus sophorae]
MNRAKLKEAEERFFMQYPGGFSDPLMLEIAKKHKVEKMKKLAQDSFAIEQFESSSNIVDSMSKIVGQSSLVSLFEKPKFRDALNAMDDNEKERLSHGLKEFLYGDQERGFEQMSDLLGEYKVAKWPILTVCPIYYRPSVEVFVKPTTAKGIIAYFQLEGLEYRSNPTYEFYKAYRDQINLIKQEVDASLQYDNAAFCGFLIMSMA